MEEKGFQPEELLGPLNEVEKKNAPKELFIAGDGELLRSAPRVAVVGSRKVSDHGVSRTASLSRILVERGITVVSGLAEGVDTVAHETAIEAGGRTIAVLGTPLDEWYPSRNRELQEKIRDDHLLVSQFPVGHPSRRENFPRRNRTMALIADATVIVEARDGSGSLHQGWEALRLGRPLFLLESLVRNDELTWPAEMLGYGAEPLSRDNLELLFEQLPEGTREERSEVAF